MFILHFRRTAVRLYVTNIKELLCVGFDFAQPDKLIHNQKKTFVPLLLCHFVPHKKPTEIQNYLTATLSNHLLPK